MSYTIPSNGSHSISLDKAVDMTTLYREEKETILASTYQNQNILCNSETFALADVETLVSQTGCAGLRIYYGMDANLKVHAILVGINEEGGDMLPTTDPDEPSEMILETGQRCPTTCPPESALNP